METSYRLRIVCGSRSIIVEAQRSWNVLFLRQVAASRLGLSGNRQLIQAGRLLPDLMQLDDLQPSEDTCFHLSLSERSSVEQENEHAIDGSSWRSWRRFFVYCRTCDNVRDARLRIHCGRCGSGAFLLPSPAPAVHSFADLASNITGCCPDCESSGDHSPAPMGYSFRCTADRSPSAPHTCVQLPRLRDNWRQGGYDCLACMECRPGPLLHFPCAAEHCLCLACFRSYAVEAMQSQGFRLHQRHGWTISCPARCSRDAVLDDPHHFLLLGPNFYSRMKARGAEAVVAHEGGGFCPNRECGEAWLPGGDEDRVVECRECGSRICRRCRALEHRGECDAVSDGVTDGEEVMDQQMQVPIRPPSPSSIQSTLTVRAISRRCPGCLSPTERSGGCMHMTCARCGFEWCWICRRAWSSNCQADHWFA